ncbi:hypothetical protein RN001_003990 [Aquatica leii]|uniref:Alpha-(1,6)-fucosyltransferase n=1 Tax=Aquatica leii TaxID=1421715 RepID=A0AAN7Q6U7_9COLE|nr:hypothetical protein RN001_003990 [Aquatica leii]
MEKLTKVDGFNIWRQKESADLSNIVQKRLQYLQHPADCKNAKKIVSTISYFCGFGCQMHHLVHAMILAYGLERTLILESTDWPYHQGGWNKVFMPVSNSCTTVDDAITVNWPGNDNATAIRIPPYADIIPRSQYMPLAVPEDLVDRLKTIHGNPIVWWIGQILKYVWKLQPITTAYINHYMKKFEIKYPFVGVQIRRTDKLLGEAQYYSIEEYMDVVDEYYNSIETKTNLTKRRIYIGTEDYNVIVETKAKYPHYEILYNKNLPEIPNVELAHMYDNVFDVILDLHIQVHSDLLVCTFSSNICRLIYALIQNNYVDASAKAISLDTVYWYYQQEHNKRRVILSHEAESSSEIDLKAGDVVNITEYGLNGYSFGTNLRTKKEGWYPSFKVEMEIEIVKFPNYSKIDSKETTF